MEGRVEGRVVRRSLSVSSKIRLHRLHTSGLPYERPRRLELYGEARRKPPTLRRRAAKNTKNPSLCWGRAFWTESGSLRSVSKSIIPPPPFWGYLKSGKMPFWHIFRTIFSFSKLTKCCKLQHFCGLTSFAGAIQKRSKCCKYQCFLD